MNPYMRYHTNDVGKMSILSGTEKEVNSQNKNQVLQSDRSWVYNKKVDVKL